MNFKLFSLYFAQFIHKSHYVIGAQLGLHKFQTYRAPNKRKPDARVALAKGVSSELTAEWTYGSSLADSQNFARVLMEVSVVDLERLSQQYMQFSMFLIAVSGQFDDTANFR